MTTLGNIVRLIYVVIVPAIAYFLWGVLTTRMVLPWQTNSGLLVPEKAEWLAFLGLVFGIFAVTQIGLRLFAFPDPQVELYNGGKLLTLGGDGPPTDPRIVFLNQHAVMHVAVRSPRLPWPIEQLMGRAKIEGAQIRFRYFDLDKGQYPFGGDKWLLGRWNDNPEPVSSTTFIQNDGSPLQAASVSMRDQVTNRRLPALFPTPDRGPEHAIATVSFLIKRIGQPPLYHFNDDTYGFDHWERPDYLLDGNNYRVDVRLFGYGLPTVVEKSFRLANAGNGLADVNLSPWFRV